MTINADRWNHNIHYHPVILESVATGAKRALDIGCGEGMLTRELRQLVPEVVGIDLDQTSIDLARAHPDSADIDYVLGDFLTHPLELASFDVIASVATLHHMDATTALSRMRDLLRPGGTLVVVGLARSRLPADLPIELAAVVATRVHMLTKDYWQHPSPVVWPPPVTYRDMRHLGAQLLPGSHYRRHLLWRYSLTWTKPVG